MQYAATAVADPRPTGYHQPKVSSHFCETHFETGSVKLDFRKDPAILQSMVDAMADGLFTVDAKGRFVAWSDGAERITGYTANELIGQPCNILEGPNCKGFAKLADLLESADPKPEGICDQECKLLSKQGQELYIHGNVRLLFEEDGRIAGAVGTFTNLTNFILANERIAVLEEQARTRVALGRLVGRSAPMQEVFRRLRLAADSDVTVLLTGESGTGKELAAEAVQMQSTRKSAPFVSVNCSAIPETLLESELFGHVKGAFTGAVKDKTGMFQSAEGGTLFLDEIGDISPLLQLKLLRALQEKEIRRVGDERSIKVDVRVITATNKDLKSLIAQGEFREDFYYRIHVFEIALPPLRQRREDIPLLVDYFIQELAKTQHRNVSGVTREALQRLMEYPWPGNVRELRNAIEHAMVLVASDTISLLDLPPEIRHEMREAARLGSSCFTEEQQAERKQIIEALGATDGNRTKAAKQLGISRVTLWKKIRKLEIPG